ncbi:hypothetical protein B0H63DRAFT_470579 [Podospora didyma]|uniref:Uncharacterized protein n=1 Tax=Podospora didyma TaxID=330526 RepID=A0AAE0NTZ9_9PEZI|nr:hypothetical protein B0H63DRAFT_470579 [Podospora didyma]
MSSLVSNYIVNPIRRQARRFSSGFAPDELVAVPALEPQHHRTSSAGGPSFGSGSAILEGDEEGRILGWTAIESESSAGAGAGAFTAEALLPITPRSQTIPDSPRDCDAPPPSSTTMADRSATASPTSTAGPRQPPSPTEALDVARDTLPSVAARWLTDPALLRSSTPLPEDDGMGALRARIRGVQAMDISQTLKAQLMHQILLEGYTKAKLAPDASPSLKPGSPSGRSVPDTAEPSSTLQSLKFWNQQGDGTGALNVPLSEDDLRPTYAPPVPTDDIGERLGKMRVEDHGHPVLGCEHYRRNVKLQCATCDRWYTCRFCHDAAEGHVLPRKDTKNMLCMLCGCAQRASDTCTGCGESAAYYFCGICKLWNDDPDKSIYHCNDCGLCRVGQGLGKDFFHCKKCMACISMHGGHKCIERSIDCDCPICGEYMFSSPKPVVFMQCGHSIHRHCFDEHMKTSYKCPLCNKSCLNMEYQFRNFDMAILTQPMPAEYRDARAVVSCNDCSAKSQTAYHWLGLKCSVCNSYNTVQQQLLNMPGSAPSQVPPPVVEIRPFSHTTLPAPPQWVANTRERTPSPPLLPSPAPSRSAPSSPSALPPPPPSSLLGFFPRPSVSPEPDHTVAVGGYITPTSPTSAIPIATIQTAQEHDTDDEEDGLDDERQDIFDFWGRDRDDHRNVTSAESADGVADEELEEESSSEEEDACEDDDDDDEEAIVLVGHR